MKKVAIYVRKSRKDENKSKEQSLENQVDTLIRLAEQHSYSYEIYKEIGSSVDNSRPEYNRMHKDIQSGKYDNSYVLLTDIDRLSRHKTETFAFLDVIKEHNIKLHLPEGILDLNKDDVNLSNSILIILNQQEYNKTRKKLLRGKLEAAKSGKYISSIIPLGYKRDPITKELIVDNDKASIVKLIFKLILEGTPVNSISHILNEKGLTNQNNKPFSVTGMKYIVKNPVYIGTNRYHSKALNEGHMLEDAHEAIISKDTFYKAQSIIISRTRGYGRRSKLGVKSPLNSLIVCAHCACTLLLDKDYQYKTPTFYTKKCHNCGLTIGQKVSVIEEAVFNTIQNYRDKIKETIEGLSDDASIELEKEINSEIEYNNVLLEQLDKKTNNLLDLYIDGNLEKSVYLKKKDEITQQRTNASLRINDLTCTLNNISTDTIKERLLSLHHQTTILDDLSAEEQNNLFKLIIDKVVLEKTEKYSQPKITIQWKEL